MLNMEKIRKRIEAYMSEFGSRGMAVAIVEGGETYFEVFGERNDRGDKVTTDTVFPIASITKTFTGALAAKLVEGGYIQYGDRYADYLPGFILSDPKVGDSTTIEDGLSHRSGLARNEFAWMNSGFSMEEVVDHIRYLPMMAPPRTIYHYTNLMFTAFCWLLKVHFGKKWDRLMKEYITDEVGMKNVNFSVKDTPEMTDDYALPFIREDGVTRDVPLFDLDNVGGCGAINTSITELAKWVRFAIGCGTVDGREVLQKETFLEMVRPRIDAGNSVYWRIPEMESKGYAVGWQSDIYRGRRMLRHTGGINGFFSFLCAIPEEGIGVAVLNNTDGSAIEDLISLQIIDELLGLDSADYLEAQYRKTSESIINGEMLMRKRVEDMRSDAPLSLPPEDYCGVYSRNGYPDVTVRNYNGELTLQMGTTVSRLQHWGGDMFTIPYSERILVPVRFKVGDAAPLAVSINLEPSIKEPLEFEKR